MLWTLSLCSICVWRLSYGDIIVRHLYWLQSSGCLRIGSTDQKLCLITVKLEKLLGPCGHWARECSFHDVWEVLWLDWQVLGQHRCLRHLGKIRWGKKQHQSTWSSQSVTPPWLPVTEPFWCCSVRATQWERAAWWVREVWWAHCGRS